MQEVNPEVIKEYEFRHGDGPAKTKVLLPLDNWDYDAKIEMNNNLSESCYKIWNFLLCPKWKKSNI